MEENICTSTASAQLRQVLDRAGITSGQLWREYFLLGGRAGFVELDAHLHGCLILPDHEHLLLVRAAHRFLSRPPAPRPPRPRPAVSEPRTSTPMRSQGTGPAPHTNGGADG
jgi:hypothetical protein